MNRPEAIEHLLAVAGRATARWLEDETPNPHDLHDLTMALAAVRASPPSPPRRVGEPRAIDQRGVMTSNTFEGQRTGTMRIGWGEKDGKPYMTHQWIPDEPAPASDPHQGDLVLTATEVHAMRSLLGAWYGLWLGKDKRDDLAQRTQRRIIVASHFPDEATMGDVNRCLEKFGFCDWPGVDATSAQTPAHERVPRPPVRLSRQVSSSSSPVDCCAIVGGSTHAVIGTTHGASGRASVLIEESGATFAPLPAHLCPTCSPKNDPTPTARFLRPVRTAQRTPGAAFLPADDNEIRELFAWKLPGDGLYRLTAAGRATGQTWEITSHTERRHLTFESREKAIEHAFAIGVPYVQYLAELTGER